jgi:hypothetical protein
MTFFRRYWDGTKKFCHATFLRFAVFWVALYCIFVHFDYLKMRAKGRLSRWFFVPEWKVFRVDKDGHELGRVEQYVLFPWNFRRTHRFKLADRIYDPVEEHRRAAAIALMDRNYTTGPRNHSRSPTLSGTPQRSSAEQGDVTQEDTPETSTVFPDADSETLVADRGPAELTDKVNNSEDGEVSAEPLPQSPTRMQQAGPSRIDTSPSPLSKAFSQYSIHPDSPEPSDRSSMPIATGTGTKPRPSIPLHPSWKSRAFKASNNSQGDTIWMTTASNKDLPNPPEPTQDDEPGVIYIHWNTKSNTLQVWLLGNEKQWAAIQIGAKVQHPMFSDRYLTIRLNGTPNWITLASWGSAKTWVNS